MNTVTLFTLSDDIIFNIEVYLEIIHTNTQDSQNSNIISCKSEIHHNSPYFAMTIIPVVYNENIVDDKIHLKCNNDSKDKINQLKFSLDNSIMFKKIGPSDNDYFKRLLNHINPTQNDLDEDIDMLLKLILTKNEFSEAICDNYRKMDKFSLRGNPDLEFKYLLFSFKNGGSLYEPSYYFNYTMKLLEFIRREHNIKKTELFPFLRKFVFLVLNYLRSDGLFGPHTAISFYLYFHYKINVRCLPFDLKFDDDFHNSTTFDFMNFALIENTISLTSQLALIWGYQTKCHDKFIECVRSLNIKSQYGESLRIMELRLRESAGASQEDFNKFTEFSREFFPNIIGAHPLSNQLLDYPISLTFIHELMRLRALVMFPKELKEVVKFSLPSSMLANVMLDEYANYPENARYDFSNPQVGNYRIAVKKYYNSKKYNPLKYIRNQEEDIHQLDKPIITSFYGITSIYITQFTNQYDFSNVDLHDLMYISVSKNNPYFVLKKGILYRGYNINTGKMKGRDQNPCILVLAARDILSVEIPKSVTCISELAFANCKSLCQVTIEKDSLLVTIEERAFFECGKLKEINFENANCLKEINENAFQYSGIEKITFNSSFLAKIGEFAFSSCDKLKNVIINGEPELSIKSFAFYKSPITSIDLSETKLEAIYNYAFAKTQLTEIKLPKSLIYIGAYAFDKCKLKELSIPENVNYIPAGIIAKNKELKVVEIKSKKPVFFHQQHMIKKFKSDNDNTNFFSNINIVKEIEGKSFPTLNARDGDEKCKIDPEINEEKKLSKKIRKLYDCAFMNSNIEIFDKGLFVDNDMSRITDIRRFCFAYMPNLKIVDLWKTNIQIIPEYCFFHSPNLTQVRLPPKINKICRFAFAYTKLYKINLKELSYLKEIEDYAFYRTQIPIFYVPQSVEYIGSHFYSVSFKKMEDDISELEQDEDDDDDDDDDDDEGEEEEYEFLDEDEEGGGEEEEEEFEEEDTKENKNDEFKLDYGKTEFDPVDEKDCKIIFLDQSRLKKIESYAFYKSKIKNIQIPLSVQYINSYAFARSKADYITIPKGVRRIPDGAFFLDAKLCHLNFEDIHNINYIGSSALTGAGLLDFEIPPNVSFLADYCFYNTIIDPFDFGNALKVHEIKHKVINLKDITGSIYLPLTTTDIKEDSFLDVKFLNYDFIGKETNEIIKNIPDFEGFDEIVFTQDKKIDVNKEYNPYSKSEIEEKDNRQEIDKCIKCTFDLATLNLSDIDTIKKVCNDILENKTQIKYAIIYLYYEIASSQVTHISLTYLNTILNKLVSVLIQIDTSSIDSQKCLEKLFGENDKYFELIFLKENHIKIFNDFIGIKVKSAYSPYLYKESYSICKELNLKVPDKPSLLHVEEPEMKKLTTLTSIACAYTFIRNRTPADIMKISFVFNNAGSERDNLFELRTIAKDDHFDMKLLFDKNANKVISKQILKEKSLISNKWFDDFVCLSSLPVLDPQINSISTTYNFCIDYTLRDILDEIMKGKLKEGMKPFKYFMKFLCLEAYIELFMRCADAKYSLFNVSSRTMILNNYQPIFIFTPGNTETDFDIDLEFKRFYLLIYELITNQNIDDLMNKVENNNEKAISFEKLKIKQRDLDGFVLLDKEYKNELRTFINDVVFQICFNFNKYMNKEQTIKKKDKSFSHLLTKYNQLFVNIAGRINIDIENKYNKEENKGRKMTEKEEQITHDYKVSANYINHNTAFDHKVFTIQDISP